MNNLDLLYKVQETAFDLTFYVVINSDGQYFRRKGYGGGGNTWVDGLATARIYAKIGGARAIVTFFASNPNYPPPKIVKLTVSAAEIIDETERIEKAKARKKKEIETRELRQKKAGLVEAKRAYENAQQRYFKLSGNH